MTLSSVISGLGEVVRPQRALAIHGAVRRLIHPGRMGVLFKALAIADPALPTPPAFVAHASIEESRCGNSPVDGHLTPP